MSLAVRAELLRRNQVTAPSRELKAIFPLSTRRAVFVLDDDQSVRTGIQRLIKAHGFEAKLFDSIEALDGGANLADATCLVLDINLNGSSGIEFRRRLTARGHSVPVIFITASDKEAVRRDALDAGCIAYLTKPFPAKALIEAIKTATAHPADI
jgi:FixJ family two-component response regulator